MATTTATVPDAADLDELRAAAATCTGCALYRDATQTVFGEGPPTARAVLVGEQPGDREDRAGRPFVGPAGGVLDRALDELGVDRSSVYLTNAVKHFKFVRAERGKRRIHKTPGRTEVVACRPWLLAELREVSPEFVVLLGSVAAKALLGPSFRLTGNRGRLLDPPDDESLSAGRILVTTHPSAVLRAPDRTAAYAEFVADLEVLAKALA
ncbi:MAG TPA: UdgX family uracil-DNA binding protein [Actinophytocola sp.]|uniref:UdgX family uracil-DNA binding protein n=1 Tax=Actinophytocola sp. TaxID=1872138 RepID=UPI002DBF1190|nr:UdgX family uracil-DNA binding protein [Actinophytocola sp.]HEU5473839.1 UdgX family uracil-DNA binding protein [Actinophytocola sp.]